MKQLLKRWKRDFIKEVKDCQVSGTLRLNIIQLWCHECSHADTSSNIEYLPYSGEVDIRISSQMKFYKLDVYKA